MNSIADVTGSVPKASRGARLVRIASSTGLGTGNPYIDLFYGALSRNGIEFAGIFKATGRWLQDNRARIDATHFHWPEYMLSRKPQWVRSVDGFPGSWRLQRLITRCAPPFHLAHFRRFLRAAKTAHKRIIWTLHNLEPHERRSLTQRAGFRALAKYADLIICHDPNTRAECLRRYQTHAEVVVMRFGNYDGAYPEPRCRSVVRTELGLDQQKPLLCCLGCIRHYKGFDLTVEAVGSLGGEVQLVVAGGPIKYDLRQLTEQAARYQHMRVIPRRLSEQEFADLAHASDGVLLPYRNVTGSSVLLAAVTFRRGVIASDLPFFRETLEGHPEAGVLFRPGDAPALAEAIRHYLAIPPAAREAAARALADQYSWDRVIVPVVDVLNRWRRDSREDPQE